MRRFKRSASMFVLLLMPACQSTQAPEPEGNVVACVKGSVGCPCDAIGACRTTDTNVLVCQQGWCVPRACDPGQEGCACFGNGSCSPKDGVPMTCEGNVCKPTETSAVGELGGACDDRGACDGTTRDLDLMCVQGRCELAGCASGQAGCGCGPYGACDAGSRCLDGLCVASSCVVGAPGCPCDESSSCAQGYACQAGLCRKSRFALTIRTDAARACDVLIHDGSALLDTVASDASTRFALKRRDNRVAIATFHTDDSAYAPDAITLSSSTAPYVSKNDVRVLSIACFDADGNPLEDAEVSLDAI